LWSALAATGDASKRIRTSCCRSRATPGKNKNRDEITAANVEHVKDLLDRSVTSRSSSKAGA